jgi:hypothetical protein
MLRLLALLSVTALCVVSIIIILTDPQGKQVSISEHAASRRWSYLLFGVSITIFGSLFDAYLLILFGPHFGLPLVYYLAVVISWICWLLLAWIPAGSGKQDFQSPHYRVAFAWGLMVFLIMTTLAFAHNVSTATRVIATITTAWYVFTIYLGVFASRSSMAQRLSPYYLIIQSLNIVSFFGVMMGVAFLG